MLRPNAPVLIDRTVGQLVGQRGVVLLPRVQEEHGAPPLRERALLLLHLAVYAPLPARRRRNLNYWLAFFGKWTLTDVLVWCACIGLFHGLSLDDGLLALWTKVEKDGVDLCALVCSNTTRLGAAGCLLLSSH